MTPRTYWQNYVDATGGPTAVAERLGIPYTTIASITNGWRGIGRRLALRMAAADGQLDPAVLAFVAATKPAQSPASQGERATGKRAA